MLHTVKYVYTLYTDTGDDSVLRQVVLPVIQWERCHDIDGYDRYIHPNMICAGTSGKDSCGGDSGGPLVCKQGDRWFQHGIVSFGVVTLGDPYPCGRPNSPGVFANVVALQSWIQEKTGSLYHYTTIHIVRIIACH